MDEGTQGGSQLALVTGGGRGIGAAICKQLAAGGWRVAVNYVNDEEAASATVAEIHRAGGDARAYQADTSDPRAIEKLFDTLNGDFGQVTALVNNAGVTGPVSRLRRPRQSWGVHLVRSDQGRRRFPDHWSFQGVGAGKDPRERGLAGIDRYRDT